MSRIFPTLVMSFLVWSGSANAQYINDRPSGPLFGTGDYAYPVLCTNCSVWQDYRNFAWNQLTINGGEARTPSHPRDETQFRIYTHRTNDLYPAIVEITVETESVEFMGETIGQQPADSDHFFVETHPENGDNVATAYYPGDMGQLQFPYVPPPPEGEGGGGSGGGSSSGGGGDSSGGGGGTYCGGGGGAGACGGAGGGYAGGSNGNYCGAGTDYECIQR